MPALVRCLLSLLMPLCACLLLPVCAGAQSAPGSGYKADPKFQAAMLDAKHLSAQRQYGFAADSYKKANKIAGGQCESCLEGMYHAQLAGGSYKDAVATASALEAIAKSSLDKSSAEFLRGQAFFVWAGDKAKQDKLEAAHGALQEAVGNYPKNAAALYLDGQVLARLGKLDEAKTQFTACLQCASPHDPARLRAEHFAEDPELATHLMAPAFEVTAMDGSRFNLDAMGGRVVLIDCWATWCGPCNREIPHMQAIAKEFAGQPLVMISVSLDKDEAKWKDFVAKHGMSWVQYRDADGKLGEQFGVSTIPRYFTIDSDGVLTSVMVAEGSDVEGKLKKLLAKADAAQKENVATVQPPASTRAAQ